MSETVAAIATPLMAGSIGIIRISGDDAISITEKVFRPVNESKKLDDIPGYTAAYGHVYDRNGDIDDGVVLIFRAPHSYTGENVAEISLHGGPVVMKQALRAVLDAGASQAAGGEFTKRAFLNGKLSLTQAEAVMDVISSESTGALQCAEAAKNGAIYNKISDLCARLTFCAASIAAYVDFPDEGVQDMDDTELINEMNHVSAELATLIDRFDTGSIIKNGINCVIAGKPNVGKSTLMNLISGHERSIVTSIAGTTRDVVEETVELDGIMLNLSDTAGLHDGTDEVEKIGIERTKLSMKNAQLVLAVFAADVPADDGDIEILNSIGNTPVVIIINKTDLNAEYDDSPLKKYGEIVYTSAANSMGLDKLRAAITKCCSIKRLNPNDACLANERQLTAAKSAKTALDNAASDIAAGQTLDAVGVLLEDAIAALLELNGENVSESVVSEVFSKFCVGK